MADLIIDRRGLFWRGDLAVPEKQFAHESCIAGGLTINANGKIELKLDGVIQVNDERRRLPHDPLTTNFQIAGILFGTNEHVRLFDIIPNSGGGWSSNGPAFEVLWPLICFIGSPGSTWNNVPFEIKSLSFSLSGYEDWFWLNNVANETTQTGFTLTYVSPANLIYEFSDYKFEIIFDVGIDGLGLPYAPPKIEEKVFLEYTPKVPCSVKRAAELSRYFDDLFLILTDIDNNLHWPEAVEEGGSKRLTCYYYRGDQAQTKKASRHEVWTTFPQIKEHFSSLVDHWLRKREKLGPAFYMYTGSRRARSIYSEHKFISFVSGLESLHRRTFAASEDLKARTTRILEQIADDKDKKWLKGYLKHSHEPRLEQRLYELLSKLPIKFSKKELHKFAERCAACRNKLSHFAGTQDTNEQRGFYDEIQLLTEPLDFLYHAMILQEIGLPPEVLRKIFFKSWSAFKIRESLKRAGLSMPAEN